MKRWLESALFDIEIEIGYGNGEFLCNLAQFDQGARYIGVDAQDQCREEAMTRARDKELDNVLFLQGYGCAFLQKIAPESIDVIHIYFPSPTDPRTHTYRWEPLMTECFVDQIYRVLRIGGVLRLVTDHLGYYQRSLRLLKKAGFWFKEWEPHSFPIPRNFLVNTPFERRYRKAGREIYSIYVIK